MKLTMRLIQGFRDLADYLEEEIQRTEELCETEQMLPEFECPECVKDDLPSNHYMENNPVHMVPTKAIVFKRGLWPKSSTLKIYFENGSEDSIIQALEALEIWGVRVHGLPMKDNIKYVNLFAQRVNYRDESNVRFSFQAGGGWAYVGRSDYFKKTVTTISSSLYSAPHEWGHVLARPHEHMSGEDAIPWDKDYVYEYMSRKGWSRSQVDRNFFQKFHQGDVYDVDPDRDTASVMHYRFPVEFVLPHGRDDLAKFSVQFPSVRDKEKLIQDYGLLNEEPQKPEPKPEEPKPEEPKPEPTDPYADCKELSGHQLACGLKVILKHSNDVRRLSKTQMRLILHDLWEVDTGGLNRSTLIWQITERLKLNK